MTTYATTAQALMAYIRAACETRLVHQHGKQEAEQRKVLARAAYVNARQQRAAEARSP